MVSYKIFYYLDYLFSIFVKVALFMKWTELLAPMGFALLGVWAFNWYFSSHVAPSTGEVKSGQMVRVIQSSEVAAPLKLGVDIVDEQLQVAPVQTFDAAGTDVTARFTTAGGSIDALSFKRVVDGKNDVIKTMMPGLSDRTNSCFFVGFDGPAPLHYALQNTQDTDTAVTTTMVGESPSVRVTKEFKLSKTNYTIDLTLTIEPLVSADQSAAATPIRPRIFVPAPLPMGADEAAANSSDPDEQKGFVWGVSRKAQRVLAKDMPDCSWASPEIFGAENKYFLHALVKDQDGFVKRGYFRPTTGHLVTILEGPVVDKKTTWRMTFYCGPKESYALSAVDIRLEAAMDYGWFAPIAKLTLFLLKSINDYVHNYGWSIVLLTLLMRLLMFPFTKSSEKGMLKQREMSKKLKYVEAKYADDPERLAIERQELVQKYGVVGGMGCLSMLLQIPLFIGLSSALRNSIELYKAPFIFWIHDLSMPDPYYILPILVGVGVAAAAFGSQQSGETRQRLIMIVMAVFLTVVTASFSAGLSLYIAVGGLLGVAQTRLVKWLKW